MLPGVSADPDRQMCLVLELATCDLGERLTAQPRLTSAQCVYVMAGLGRALAHMHLQNPSLIHRDVKPSNVNKNKKEMPHTGSAICFYLHSSHAPQGLIRSKTYICVCTNTPIRC